VRLGEAKLETCGMGVAAMTGLAKTHSLLIAKSKDAANLSDPIRAGLDPYDDQTMQRTSISEKVGHTFVR
jgi:hypothetical protein